VIVTGAGAGIGRLYALEFAKRGAKVVVNDLGCSMLGEGSSKDLADRVVEEIVSKGGMAVASYDSVEFGDKIVRTALDHFGRVDVLINNAGIIRDNGMSRITEKDWDMVIRTHLKGTFSVTRAAWQLMKNQKYGRIVNTTSAAALNGNFGQANYSSAKTGIHGFTLTIAREGEKYNIRSNTIAPIAESRMTQGIFNKGVLELLSGDKVVPAVVYLAHESCSENGSLIETTGGWVTKLRWQRGNGIFFSKPFTAEDVEKRIEEVNKFEICDYPKNGTDTLMKVLSLVEEANYPKPKI